MGTTDKMSVQRTGYKPMFRAADQADISHSTMSTNLISSGTTAREKVNLRTPEVMTAVQEQVESHYRSDIVDKVRRAGGILQCGDVTARLAKEFGVCYGSGPPACPVLRAPKGFT